jgi:hypothetical protein
MIDLFAAIVATTSFDAVASGPAHNCFRGRDFKVAIKIRMVVGGEKERAS